MARTRASVGAKLSSGKSSKARSSVAPAAVVSSTSGSEKARSSSGGGNPVCQRETPKWQKPITNFFISKDDRTSAADDDKVAGSSKTKKNVIQSDSESEEERPTNRELDETLELESLDGDSSHKMEEYFDKDSKGKGAGKKSKRGKENVNNNVRSSKRDIEDITFGEESGNANKKIKVM